GIKVSACTARDVSCLLHVPRWQGCCGTIGSGLRCQIGITGHPLSNMWSNSGQHVPERDLRSPQNRGHFMRQMLPWSTSIPTRRRIIAAGLVGLGTGAAALGSSLCRAAGTTTLRKLATEKGLLYGTTIAAAQITGDRPFANLVCHEAGLIVAEN